ncbi:MAG: hypothetical protein AAFX54_03565 [Pseudomonadota bacterium]
MKMNPRAVFGLAAYMDWVEGDAVDRGGAACVDEFCAALLARCPHRRLRSRQFQRGDNDRPLELNVRLLVDMHCMTADAEAGLCDAFHDFYRGLLGLYPTAALFCRRYDRIRFEDPDWLRWSGGVFRAFASRLQYSSPADTNRRGMPEAAH